MQTSNIFDIGIIKSLKEKSMFKYFLNELDYLKLRIKTDLDIINAQKIILFKETKDEKPHKKIIKNVFWNNGLIIISLKEIVVFPNKINLMQNCFVISIPEKTKIN